MNSLQGAYSVSAPAASRQRAERTHELPTKMPLPLHENDAVSSAYDATRLRGVRGPWSGGFSWTWPFYDWNEGGSITLLSSWSKEAGTNDDTKQSSGTLRYDSQPTYSGVKATQPTHHPGMVITIVEKDREVDRIRGGCCPGWNGWARLSCSKDNESQVGIQIPALQQAEQQPTQEQSPREPQPEEQSQDEKSRQSPALMVDSTPTTGGTNPAQEAGSVAESSPLAALSEAESNSHPETLQKADQATGIGGDQVSTTDGDERDVPHNQAAPQGKVVSPSRSHSTTGTPTREDLVGTSGAEIMPE